jgi:ribose transport system permease protein
MSKLRSKLDISMLTSIILLVAIFIVFLVLTDGNELSRFSLANIIDSSIIYIIAGLGCLFVVSMGSCDLSLGVNLGISAVVGTGLATIAGTAWLAIPITLLTALGIGLLNGFLVGTMKVPSFMVTIAWLIGIRGMIIYMQTEVFDELFPTMYYQTAGPLLLLKNGFVKYTLFVALIVVFYIFLTHTKFGGYCRAIGENELVARNIGMPVPRIKLLAFGVSGLMAGVAALFYLAKNGGTNNTIGQNLEVDVLACVFAGCILVTGGFSTKLPKLLLGCFTFAILKNGLGLCGFNTVFAKELSQGLVMILIMFAVIKMKDWEGKRAIAITKEDEKREALHEKIS